MFTHSECLPFYVAHIVWKSKCSHTSCDRTCEHYCTHFLLRLAVSSVYKLQVIGIYSLSMTILHILCGKASVHTLQMIARVNNIALLHTFGVKVLFTISECSPSFLCCTYCVEKQVFTHSKCLASVLCRLSICQVSRKYEEKKK